jgi:dienelactone hydrolase
MKNTMRGLGWMLVWGASAAYAAQGGEGESVGWLGYLFTGFFALVIVTQLVPAAILFYGMIKGIFSAREEKDTAAVHIE